MSNVCVHLIISAFWIFHSPFAVVHFWESFPLDFATFGCGHLCLFSHKCIHEVKHWCCRRRREVQSVFAIPKSVQVCSGQGSVQDMQVLPYETCQTVSSWTCTQDIVRWNMFRPLRSNECVWESYSIQSILDNYVLPTLWKQYVKVPHMWLGWQMSPNLWPYSMSYISFIN